MKVKELKKWDLFYNTNRYECLVYKITKSKVYVVNTNGTFYAIDKDSKYSYDNERPNMSVTEFFDNFPNHVLTHYKDKIEFESIKNLYKVDERQVNKKLLLC